MTELSVTGLRPDLRAALIRRLIALADDELILAQRLGEWTGHAPILEEDIALANLAQDELGHATLWLGLRAGLDGSDPDRLAYFRDVPDFLNAPLVEWPRGDWAFTMLRQYLFDAYELLWLDAARAATWTPLAEVAHKAVREERFHLQHTALWATRLGLGTPESNRRMQAALDLLWPLAQTLFVPLDGEPELVAAGVVPDLAAVQTRWTELVTAHLTAAELTLPEFTGAPRPRGGHTEHLAPLLAEFQSVARAHPEAVTW